MGVIARDAPDAAVVWHQLEYGGYVADLPLWQELAAAATRAGETPVLEVGAGCGRVALALAARGHDVTAVDIDPLVLAELDSRARARGLRVRSIVADARELRLERRHALALAPMQTIQLLGGSEERARFFARIRALLLPGGLFAAAFVETIEPFRCDADDAGEIERVRVGELTYESATVGVVVDARLVTIERERRVRDAAGSTLAATMHLARLARVNAATLESEGAAAGLRPVARRRVPATDEYTGSEVVVLGA